MTVITTIIFNALNNIGQVRYNDLFGGLHVDFTNWQNLQINYYFLAGLLTTTTFHIRFTSLGKVSEVFSHFGVAILQLVGFVLQTMEAKKFRWQFASMISHFENQISVSGSPCSFKLKPITCYPNSGEKNFALARKFNCLHLSSSS